MTWIGFGSTNHFTGLYGSVYRAPQYVQNIKHGVKRVVVVVVVVAVVVV